MSALLCKELDILTCFGRNDSLRIAYIHEAKQMIDGKPFTEYYSKLVKADPSGKDQVKANVERCEPSVTFMWLRVSAAYVNLQRTWIDSFSNKEHCLPFYFIVLRLIVVLYIVQEIYSIKLPGEVILGEGKPENQNHAIVFTRGEALQTIDMNQVDIISIAILLNIL